ncbi:1-acyl-sn-glycerol-3-phosphate acyltransferase [Nitrogeniibacter mangrovi]|uniref:1-acyl-sn-glycerol-3-phosphate acyltransferase n=1 Tax=Nitrogeniibacter mangrovi TaxID=2016596 RepID=A0A6C1AYL5_9RHOO|nr:lysophospholipid acyltransferase family protein [Nitrogeniibacter mangrovi]QID16462.1 1-acyl-sn-glycerol-3-phosphate acyltransferase [Nitrogeniibacter mangrovi]
MSHTVLPLLVGLRERLRFHAGLGMLGVLGLGWFPLASLLHLVLPARLGRPLGRRAIRFGFDVYLRWLSLIRACRFELDALDALRDGGPLILVANHPCLIDAPLILSRLPDVACVMKTALMRNPLFGGAARLARYVRNEPSVGMVLTAVENLRAGSHLLLFPEATRTVAKPLNRFTPSTALIAQRAQVPVQTLIIETDSAFLCKGWPVFRQPRMPIRYRVRLGERFDPPGDVAEFTARLEAYFTRALAESAMAPPVPCP